MTVYAVFGYTQRGSWLATGAYSQRREVAQAEAERLTKKTGRVHAVEPLTEITEDTD